MTETVIGNARIVLRHEVVHGAVQIRGGRIAAVDTGPVSSTDVDLEGDWLLPGFVELHTDNLERCLVPRPKVYWPADAAIAAHDGQIAAAGITTVCDAICVGIYGGKEERSRILEGSVAALARARAAHTLRVEHRLHLRLEVPDPNVVALAEPMLDDPSLVLVSLMDHTPGQRQWHDLDRYRTFQTGRGIAGEAAFDELVARRRAEHEEHATRNRRALVAMLEGRTGILRASHDDTTPADVAESAADGVTIAEFPTTLEAALLARDAGMAVIMGAPNLVLGGSHSGNVGAADLVPHGLLDMLSSDYVPASLVEAVFLLHRAHGIHLPDAVATVSATPAATLGLDDRGTIAAGLRADLVRVRTAPDGGNPAVMAAWCEGQRVA